MSGGFFRGTSADQDTRFSNKQAKLLKSQKFPPELDHVVDMTKVKMDVIRPWIAKRATELLGFEDEVLINFVYGLLDGKEVDGKQIQIQLTGFMEKNTGKFMKELWGLLLSAQSNVSGVPQQFLDAKEEETLKKKAETDRIAHEIQKRRDRDREGRGPERERKSGFDDEANGSKFTKAASDSLSKFSRPRASSIHSEDREDDRRHGSRAMDGSPPSNDRPPSPSRKVPSPTRSNKNSVSRSRSNSDERHKSRSLSTSPKSPRRSVSPRRRRYQSPERRSLSPKRRYRSPPMRSISPRRRHSPWSARSPSRRRSPRLRRRSRSRHRSPSPIRYRSPVTRRRSPRRRSPSPYRRRSPPRRELRRSPSPYRRRSPIRRRSPSPIRRRSPSPARHRSPLKARKRLPSPVQRRSPIRRRSVSPSRGRSPSPRRRASPPRYAKHLRRSPLHSHEGRSADSPVSPTKRKRSQSPRRSRSPSYQTDRSLSTEHDGHANGSKSRQYQDDQTSKRTDVKQCPTKHPSGRKMGEQSGSKLKVSDSVSQKPPVSLRSPQRDSKDESRDCKKTAVVSPENSLSRSVSPNDMRKGNSRAIRRSGSLSRSPVRTSPVQQTSGWKPRHDSPGTGKEEEHMTRKRESSHKIFDSSRKRSRDSYRDIRPDSHSPGRRELSQSPAASGRPMQSKLKKDGKQGSDLYLPGDNHQPNSSEGIEYAPGRVGGESDMQGHVHDWAQSSKLHNTDASMEISEHDKQAIDGEGRHQKRDEERNEIHQGTQSTIGSKKKTEKKNRLDKGDSDLEETYSHRNENVDKRRHKKSDKRKRDYDETSESDDSEVEDKKEAKRRRKDEKRMRKEERRQRREEKHRRKLERRANKAKMKSSGTVSPPSSDKVDHDNARDSDSGGGRRKNSHLSDADETESEQKKLEIELREKALESLRAKKAISH